MEHAVGFCSNQRVQAADILQLLLLGCKILRSAWGVARVLADMITFRRSVAVFPRLGSFAGVDGSCACTEPSPIKSTSTSMLQACLGPMMLLRMCGMRCQHTEGRCRGTQRHQAASSDRLNLRCACKQFRAVSADAWEVHPHGSGSDIMVYSCLVFVD
jgi:hypothetical protein